MDVQKKIEKSISEYLSKNIGEIYTPKIKEILKQNIMAILSKALAEGEIEKIPGINLYGYEDSRCKKCGYDMYNHTDPTYIDVEIGYKKRPEYCSKCIIDKRNMQKIYEEI